MNITIKESMIIRKCLNDYVLENNLDYDKSPLFNDLIYKLKENDRPLGLFDKDGELKNQIEIQRKSLNKELKKYSIQTTCNKKILELMKLESIELVNKQKELIK